MFGALDPEVVPRIIVAPGEPFTLAGGIEAELFTVPGKVPLYLEGENPAIEEPQSTSASNCPPAANGSPMCQALPT